MAEASSTKHSIITLTTDFGTQDHYAASMKGIILSENPSVTIVDITHQIAPQAVVEAGFVLACAFQSFPAGTIHILVVDPGVGTSRRLLLARTENHLLLAPDNGALGLVFEREPAREVHAITAGHHFRKGEGATFDGRDILAPVAARLARGTALHNFGNPVTDWLPFPVGLPSSLDGGAVVLEVLHIDRFGNVVLGLTRQAFVGMGGRPEVAVIRLEIGGRRIERLLKTYGESSSRDPFALFNSSGYLELAVRNGSAAEVLSAKPGDRVVLSL